MLKWTLVLCLAFLLGITASARVRPRGHKNFPATHDSVHLENEVANSMGAYRYFTQAQVDTDVINRHLSAIHECTVYVVAPKLSIERRYALPATTAFLYELSKEYYEVFKQPLMVDSAIRPATVQRGLHMRNAAPAYGENASSHERGTTVDLSRKMSKTEYKWLIVKLLYYRAIGRILVIEERHCFHIFVIGDLSQ
jgi:hypothetical protein